MKWLTRLGISLTVAFFVVCCGAVLLFNWSALGWKALTVPTGSMRPTIPPGSLVLMHNVPLSSLKVGDVITYINPETMKTTVTHRIIKEYKLDGKVPAFVTKGDANKSADPWIVVGGLVQGRAVWHAPDIGGWLSWTKTWVGLVVLVYIPASLLMVEEVMRLNDYYRKSKPYLARQLVLLKSVQPKKRQRLAQATSISIVMIAASALVAFPAEALLRSNTVTLGPNNIKVATATVPTQCTSNGNNTNVNITGSSNSNNTVVVNSSSSQSASSGNATVSGNTNGGSATSGSASNSNCTNININIH